MKYSKFLLVFIGLTLNVLLVSAQATEEVTAENEKNDSVVNHSNIIEQLAVPDANTGAVVDVYQSPKIEKLLFKRLVESGSKKSGKGYRVQIYSSNNGQSARVKAFSIEKEIEDKHPEISVYVKYDAPFWKVKIGNFMSTSAANEYKKYIKKEFPEYANYTYVVPSEIEIEE